MGEALPLPVDDEVNRALRKKIDILRAMSANAAEAEPLDKCRQFARDRITRRELEKFSLLDNGRRRQRWQVGERRQATGGATRRELLANCAQRTHAVNRDRRS